jgi:hypothetical protein
MKDPKPMKFSMRMTEKLYEDLRAYAAADRRKMVDLITLVLQDYARLRGPIAHLDPEPAPQELPSLVEKFKLPIASSLTGQELKEVAVNEIIRAAQEAINHINAVHIQPKVSRTTEEAEQEQGQVAETQAVGQSPTPEARSEEK